MDGANIRNNHYKNAQTKRKFLVVLLSSLYKLFQSVFAFLRCSILYKTFNPRLL